MDGAICVEKHQKEPETNPVLTGMNKNFIIYLE